MSEHKPQTIRNFLKDQSILALIISVVSILIAIILSEVQVKVGWGILTLTLITLLLLFSIIIFLIERPIEQRIKDSVSILKKQLDKNSIDWLLDTEELMQYELETNAPEIWLLTSDLLDDTQGGPFQNIVAENLKRSKKYVYFVPDVPEIKTRIEIIFAHHNNNDKLKVVYLPDTVFFLVPKLDIVIYNPLSKGSYIKSAYMGIPAPGEQNHYHTGVSIDFIDRVVGTLLDPYKKQVTSP